jgi:hypothetical protein
MEENVEENNISEKINVMQKQIDLIQNEIDKSNQKKWYKDPSFIMSILALLLSCIFSIYGFKKEEQRESHKVETDISNDITTSVSRLLEIRSIYNKNGDPSFTLNGERQVILSKILSNLSSIQEILDASSLTQIGNELFMDGRYSDAKKIFYLGLKNSKSDMEKMYACSYLSGIYFIPNSTTCNNDSCLFYRQESLRVINSLAPGVQSFYKGSYYREIANLTYYYKKDIKMGNLYLDSAKLEWVKYYNLHSGEKPIQIILADSLYKLYNKN